MKWGFGCAQVLQQCSPVQHYCGWWLQDPGEPCKLSSPVECPCVPPGTCTRSWGRAVGALGAEPWAVGVRAGAAQCAWAHVPQWGVLEPGQGSGLSRGIRDTSGSPVGLHALEEANNPWRSRQNLMVWVFFPTLSTLLRYSDNFRVVEVCLSWNSSLRTQCCCWCSRIDIKLSSHGVFLCAGSDFILFFPPLTCLFFTHLTTSYLSPSECV